ncbi:unnamed protein product, partial [Mesorhabditis belari]|uniref:Uncharacterized protein n=1 Tax=Mesorhabditis belari TaxID=2138241 RepID=A0AAF3ENZ9_9BILA
MLVDDDKTNQSETRVIGGSGLLRFRESNMPYFALRLKKFAEQRRKVPSKRNMDSPPLLMLWYTGDISKSDGKLLNSNYNDKNSSHYYKSTVIHAWKDREEKELRISMIKRISRIQEVAFGDIRLVRYAIDVVGLSSYCFLQKVYGIVRDRTSRLRKTELVRYTDRRSICSQLKGLWSWNPHGMLFAHPVAVVSEIKNPGTP